MNDDNIQTPLQGAMSMIYSVNQLIAERTREYPDLEILGIPDKNFNVSTMYRSMSNSAWKLTGSIKYTKYTYTELDASASLLAHHLRDNGLLNGRSKGDTTSKMTVGLLGVSNISYVVTEMALYRMGYCSCTTGVLALAFC